MDVKRIDTIIIGGGISGLSCAKKLHDNGKKFLLLTEDIGGRILSSKDGKVNYGAYYVRNDYKHIKKFVKLGRKINPWKINFYARNKSYKLLDKKFLLHPLQAAKLVVMLYIFKRHFHKFQKRCENVSQAEALREDKFLWRLYKQKGAYFIREHNLNYINQHYLNGISRVTAFISSDKINAFGLLEVTLPLIVPIYEFQFLKDKITKGFRKQINFDTVLKITKSKNNITIKTKKRTYLTKNLVVATPPKVSKKLLKLKKMNGPVFAHMFHLTGKIKLPWKKGMNVLSSVDKDLVLVQQKDKTFLLFSKKKHPNFKKFFTKYKIIKRHFWNPAFNLISTTLWESDLGNNLYLIGDHNCCGMEDSFITGIYAANKIISNS